MKKLHGIEISRGVEDLKITLLSVNDKTVTYKVENAPICEYDQHSRARVGVEFKDYQVSKTPRYIMYTHTYDTLMNNPAMLDKFIVAAQKLEKMIEKAALKDDYYLMSRSCEYTVVQTYESLAGQMSRRLKFCEEEFIVGVHWKLRQLLMDAGYSKANDYLPGCDYIKKCDYSQADFLSNAFGCLFASCGRWPSNTEYATFNESCTTPNLINEQLNLVIPKSEYEIQKENESRN